MTLRITMATDKQVNRIKYLRGNGLSQKEIANDVGLSPQMVSVVLKKLSAQFNESKPVRVVSVLNFKPKETVIEFPPAEFENIRESETLYGSHNSLYEMRSGIVHQTTLPDIIPVEIYPQVADLLSNYDFPTVIYSKEDLTTRFGKLCKSKIGSQRHKWKVLSQFLLNTISEFGIESSHEVHIELSEKLYNHFLKDLELIQQLYLEDMPDSDNMGMLVRFHMVSGLDESSVNSTINHNQPSNHQIEFLKSIGTSYPFVSHLLYYKSTEELFGKFSLFVKMYLDSNNLTVDDLRNAYQFKTLDMDLINKYLATGADSVETLEEIEEAGVTNVDELEASKVAFNNKDIDLSEYDVITKNKSDRISKKITNAVDRNELDDALIHSFVLLESKAREFWGRSTAIPKNWQNGDEITEKIFKSNLENNRYYSEIMENNQYSPSSEELQTIKVWFDENGRRMQNQMIGIIFNFNKVIKDIRMRELFCRNLIRSKIDFSANNDEIKAESMINVILPILSDDGELHTYCDEARVIRNKLLHGGQLSNNLVTRHIRSILFLSELINNELIK